MLDFVCDFLAAHSKFHELLNLTVAVLWLWLWLWCEFRVWLVSVLLSAHAEGFSCLLVFLTLKGILFSLSFPSYPYPYPAPSPAWAPLPSVGACLIMKWRYGFVLRPHCGCGCGWAMEANLNQMEWAKAGRKQDIIHQLVMQTSRSEQA